MTFIPQIETTSLTLGTQDASGNFTPVAATFITKNNRGQSARVTTQFANGVPAETETIPGAGSWKRGEILIQHQLHDGRGKCRLTTTGAVDGDGGLSWVVDSTTTDPSGAKGQEDAAPIVFNVGEAKGTYVILHADGRIKFRHGAKEKITTVQEIVDEL